MTRGSPIPERVSTLELFFDLVFVFAITQVAGVVEHEPTVTLATEVRLERRAVTR